MSPFLWVLGGVAALGLIASGQVRRYERDLANDVSSRLSGPNRQVSIKTKPRGLEGYLTGDLNRVTISATKFETPELPLFTEPDREKRGRCRKLEIRLADFVLGRLHVQHLDADIPSCRYDLRFAQQKHRIRLSESGEGVGNVSLNEADLSDYAVRKYPILKQVSVRLDHGGVRIKGLVDVVVFAGQFELSGSLARNGNRGIDLVNAGMTLNGKSVDPAQLSAMLTRLNPLVDLDRDLGLHGAMDVEGVRFRRGSVEAWGKARIPSR